MAADRKLVAKYQALAKRYTTEKSVALGSGKKGFASDALMFDGKIFAMLTPNGEFVVKLDKKRVTELSASDKGLNFVMAGRAMKQWLVVSSDKWALFADEALSLARGNANNSFKPNPLRGSA